jgi:transposase InsO family protein
MNMNARETANLFFNNWYCKNGLPLSIVSDRDKLFTSKFWKALHRLTGVKLQMSTAYHPQTDGASERTNKTVDQALRYFVDRHQTGWVNALPRVRFNIMSSVNAATGYTHFHLHLGRTPRLLPPLTQDAIHSVRADFPNDISNALETIINLKTDVADTHDALLASRIAQAHSANAHRGEEPPLAIGDFVYLSTAH